MILNSVFNKKKGLYQISLDPNETFQLTLLYISHTKTKVVLYVGVLQSNLMTQLIGKDRNIIFSFDKIQIETYNLNI